ncbi:MAG TPA: LUD domain-containing protein [Candidatus Wallbacteria bacterium]|nr:LUD domain-containing protein [Candidatus Wallbacteria bacterium]
MIKLFNERFRINGGTVMHCKNSAGVVESVKNIIKNEMGALGSFKIFISDSVSEKYDGGFAGSLKSKLLSDKMTVEFALKFENDVMLTVSTPDALLLNDGAFAFAGSGEATAETLVPPFNVFISKNPRAYINMNEYFSEIYLSKNVAPPLITLISGPSRTADIEKRIVKGMHGPKKIYSIILA